MGYFDSIPPEDSGGDINCTAAPFAVSRSRAQCSYAGHFINIDRASANPRHCSPISRVCTGSPPGFAAQLATRMMLKHAAPESSFYGFGRRFD